MQKDLYQYKAASPEELARRWEKNLAEHPGNPHWPAWRAEYMENNRAGKCKTFVVLHGDDPIGEGTLLFSPACSAIGGRTELADGVSLANVNALRIENAHEGQGHISRLVRCMEQYAAQAGYSALTIGVEAKETRNLAIYLHWGYGRFVRSELEDGDLVLYYSKPLFSDE